ncbi:SlyX family protein [Neisseria leonii]|uniref:SlyX family protein n=1 Tax=Neisseria leonii TaxID=2995413 RepID=UPI00237A6770|nr:SlyX family protein [Neisseria sp. 3986]MDD9326041.1 SlyX family protein [Neisseria sp. 3986]
MHAPDNDDDSRLTELEIRLALQDDLLQSLNDTVAALNRTVALQQAQLRLLYQKLQEKSADGGTEGFAPADEIPPHY